MAPSFPLEVLTAILLMSLSPFTEQHSSGDDDELFTLVLVCPGWKDIIYRHHAFWNRISVTPMHLKDDCALLDSRLRRCGDHSNIYLHIESVIQYSEHAECGALLVSRLEAIASRIVYLQFSPTPYFRRLFDSLHLSRHDLHLDMSEIQYQSPVLPSSKMTATPRTLTLQGSYLHFHSLNLSALHEVILSPPSGSTIHQFEVLCQNAPRLCKCNMTLVERVNSISYTLRHRGLEELVINCHWSSSAKNIRFDLSGLTSLRRLEITSPIFSYIPGTAPLLADVSVHALSLELSASLRSSPLLASIAIGPSKIQVVRTLTQPQSATFLPTLARLTVHVDKPKPSDSDFPCEVLLFVEALMRLPELQFALIKVNLADSIYDFVEPKYIIQRIITENQVRANILIDDRPLFKLLSSGSTGTKA